MDWDDWSQWTWYWLNCVHPHLQCLRTDTRTPVNRMYGWEFGVEVCARASVCIGIVICEWRCEWAWVVTIHCIFTVPSIDAILTSHIYNRRSTRDNNQYTRQTPNKYLCACYTLFFTVLIFSCLFSQHFFFPLRLFFEWTLDMCELYGREKKKTTFNKSLFDMLYYWYTSIWFHVGGKAK